MIYVNKIDVNLDHVHIFFKYPPKYSLSYIAKKIKGVSSRILRKEFPHLQEFVEIYIREQDVYEYNREK
jgi:putative transposase